MSRPATRSFETTPASGPCGKVTWKSFRRGLGKDERVGTRYQIIRTLLIRRFDRIFEKEVRFEDIELPGKWGANGPLSLVQLRASDGWLTIAWKARK